MQAIHPRAFDYYGVSEERSDDPRGMAQINTKAFLRDLEGGPAQDYFPSVHFTHEVASEEVGGRFFFVLLLEFKTQHDTWHERTEFAVAMWMPGVALDDVRYLEKVHHGLEDTFKKVLINGESFLWEDAIWKLKEIGMETRHARNGD